jgi:methylamine dehydrogenase heavy chain
MRNRAGLRTWLLATAVALPPAMGGAAGNHAEDVPGRVETLPAAPSPHWLWVNDAALSSMPDGRALLVDGDTGAVLGMLGTGYSFAALTHAPVPRDEFYSAETYYSRHTRGTRTDLVTVHDARTLAVRAEIPLPPKRASTIPRLANAAITDDGRFMAVFNLTPATSLSIVDVGARRFAGEIDLNGCALVFPAGPRTLFALCFNGSALVTELAGDGTLARRYRVERLFDAEGDFIADHGARYGAAWLFPSVGGNLHGLDFSSGTLRGLPAWPLLSPAEAKEGWRMSGFQGTAVHEGRGELYFLVHRGPPESYKDPGTDVWVYDLARQRKLRRIALRQPAMSIAVSADGAPLLAALAMDTAELDLYAVDSGALVRTVPEMGVTPSLLQFPWRPGMTLQPEQ